MIELAEMLRGMGQELSDIAHAANQGSATPADIERATELEENLEMAVLNIPARLAPYLSYALALAD